MVVSADDEAPDSTGFKSAGSTGKHECPWPGLELLCEENTRKRWRLEKREGREGVQG